MAREFVCIDLDWERYCNPPRKFATEDEWWDDHYAREAEMEDKAAREADLYCELLEFESDAERQAAWDRAYDACMKELEEEWTT